VQLSNLKEDHRAADVPNQDWRKQCGCRRQGRAESCAIGEYMFLLLSTEIEVIPSWEHKWVSDRHFNLSRDMFLHSTAHEKEN
jgi:hypothetical protein